MKKKKVILTSIIVMVIMMLSIGIKVSLYEPSKINAVIASKVFKTPANTAFKDDNFYKCVVDAYNSKNKTSVAYTESLTDEQLLTITELSCDGAGKSEKEKISTSGKVTITNPKGVVLTDTGILTTGTKVKIELATETKEYTVVIKGDVTGTGEASVSDVAKLYQALKGKIEIEDCYKEAGNVYSDDNEIKINDVAKLYQFIKSKIKTLD